MGVMMHLGIEKSRYRSRYRKINIYIVHLNVSYVSSYEKQHANKINE